MKPISTKAILGSTFLVFASIPSLHAADEIWAGTTDGSWAALTNWVSGTGVPGTGDIATFDSNGGAIDLIDLGGGVTIKHLVIDTAAVTEPYTIGVAGVDTLTLDTTGANPDGIHMGGGVAADQTIAADIVLGDGSADTLRIANLSAAGDLIITGDLSTGTGGTAGNVALNLGNFTQAAQAITIDGDIPPNATASRLVINVVGAELDMNGVVTGGGNQHRSSIQNNGSITVGAGGKIGEGNMNIQWGTLNLNNTTTPQLFDNGITLGNANNGNGNAIINIAPGATLETDGNVTYVADGGFANTALISGGTVNLSGSSRSITVNDNTDVSGSELTLATTFEGINSADTNAGVEDLTINGPGTVTWNSDFNPTVNERVDVLNLQVRKTVVGASGADFTSLRRELIVRQRNDAASSDFDVEFDINGQEVLLDDDLVIAGSTTSVAIISHIRVTDSADSASSKIRLTGDNDVTYNAGGATNLTATIEADLQFEGSNFTMAVNDGADDVDLVVSGTITDDTGGTRNLTKGGGGTLKLTATDNAYNVLIVQNGGVILTDVGARGDNDIQVGNNANSAILDFDLPVDQSVLDGNQVRIGDDTVGVDIRIDGTAGGLTFDGNLDTSNGVTVYVDKTAGGDLTVLNYNLAATNTIDVLNDFTLAAGTPTSARGAGPFVNDTVNGKVTIDLGFVDNVWTGASDTTWEIGGAGANWTGGPSDTVYQEGDTVIFTNSDVDASAPATDQAVTVAADVNPGAVNFTNNTNPYSLSDNGGGEGIAGDITRTKSGTADVTINNANTYTGGTTLSAGITIITDASALGTGLVTMENSDTTLRFAGAADGGTFPSAIIQTTAGNNKILDFNLPGAGSMTLSGNINFEETAGGFRHRVSVGNDSITMSGVIAGISGFEIREGGTLTRNNGSSSFGATSGSGNYLTVRDGGTLQFTSIADAGADCSVGHVAEFRLGINNDNGTASYLGTANATSNRQVRVGGINNVTGTGGSTVANNGTGTLQFTNAAFNVLNAGNTAARILTLAGTNAGDNRVLGVIADNNTAGGGIIGLAKDGAGTWSLSASNTYTGDTTVLAGTLSLGNGATNTTLADGADVTVAEGAVLDLNYSGTDTIDELILDGAEMPAGTWGATGSGATNIDDTHFTGTGTLTVTTAGSAYALWATANSLTGSDALPGADPDGDDLENVLEFGFGTDPEVANFDPLVVSPFAVGLPTTDVSYGPLDFDAQFVRRLNYVADGLTYTAQFSADLQNWTDSTAIPVQVAADGAFEIVEVPYLIFLPDGKKASFFRVMVELN